MGEVESKIKVCPICGEEFVITNPRAFKRIYCSDFCRGRAIRKKRPKKRRPPHYISCIRCGKAFLGKYCQKYCPECLRIDDWVMRKYRMCRKDDV